MTYQSEVLTDSPLVYWRLGETTGNAADSSGNGRTGSWGSNVTHGATGLLVGDTDTAAQFIGGGSLVTDAIRVADAAWMRPAVISASCLIKPTDTATGTRHIVGRYDPATNSAAARSWFLFQTDTRVGARVVLNETTGTTAAATSVSGALTAGVAAHVGFSFDGSTIRVYLNGAEVASASISGTLNASTQVLSVGCASGSNSNKFLGTIDEVAIFGAPLAAGRFAAEYAAATGGTPPVPAVDAPLTGVGSFSATALKVGVVAAGLAGTGAFIATVEGVPQVSASLTGSGAFTATRQVEREVDAELTGTGTFTADVVALPVAHTDTHNRVGGRKRSGYAVATWEPPIADPPPTLVFGEARDVAEAHGPVTMNGTQPDFDVDTANRQRHRDRILVGGKDITYWRDVPTPLPSYQLVSPLLYGPATMHLPQVAAAFEKVGQGDLGWLQAGKTVKVQRVDADTGAVVATDYRGVVIAFDGSGGDLSVEIGGEASGRAALMERQTPIFRFTNDLGRYAARGIRGLGLPFNPPLGPDTGITLARFGGTGYLDYLSQVCARAWTRSGNQWTIKPGGDGVYRMTRKDTTTIDATAYLDDARTVGDLRRDVAEEPNRWYVTGVTPAGQRVRFGTYPGLEQGQVAPYPFADNRNFGTGTTNADTDTGDGIAVMIDRLRITKYLSEKDADDGYDAGAAEAVRQLQDDAGLPVTGTMTPATWRALYDLDATGFSLRQSEILPVAQRSSVRQWVRSSSGAVIRRNPDYERHRLKVDRNIDMGSGFTIEQMREWAFAEKESREDNWVGTLTFHTGALVAGDHAPGAAIGASDVFRARALRPGMNLRLPHSPGGNIVVHVSAVSVDEAGKVTATVDTRARDSMAVWEIITRNRESRRDPARQWIREHRASGEVKDAVDGWDEVGGVLGTAVTVPGKTWMVFPVVAGQEGTVARLRLKTDPNAEFVTAVFGRKVPAKRLARLVGNPLTKAGAKNWESEAVRNKLDDSHFLLYVAGDKDRPCGYWPKEKEPETVITTEPNPDYNPSADPDSVGIDDEPTIEVETQTGSIHPLTGKWQDDAGFGYRTWAQPVLYVAIYADRDTVIPAGRIMWPQLEAGA